MTSILNRFFNYANLFACRAFKFVLTLVFIVILGNAMQATTTYYLAAGGTVTNRLNWGTATNGTGANPPDFLTANQIFNIRNNAAPTLTAAWTVAGAGSGVTIGDGVAACNFTIPATHSLTGSVLNVFANATLTLSNNTIPTLTGCTFDPASTVNFNNGNSITLPNPVGNTYGNLTISGGAATYTMGAAYTISTLTISTAGTVYLFNGPNNAAPFIFTVANYNQSNGVVDGGNSNAAFGSSDPLFTSELFISGNFTKTAGSLGNNSPAQYTLFDFDGGGGAQTFNSTTGNNSYAFFRVTANSSLTLASNMSMDGTNAAQTTLNVAAGSTLDASTFVISTPLTLKTFLINGTVKTANLTGLSGAGGATLSNNNAPTVTLAAASTIEYNSGAAQSISTRADYGNLTITNASTKTVTGANTVHGNLLINVGATFASASFTLTIGGNFTNSGSFTYTTSQVVFNGIAQQAIGGGATTFYNLRIFNTSGVTSATGVIQNVAVSVANVMTLSSGSYVLNGNTLTLLASSTGAITFPGNNTSFIISEDQVTGNMSSAVQWNIGALNASSFIFPFGYGGYYLPFTFATTAAGAANTTVTLATYESTGNLPWPSMAGNAVLQTSGLGTNAAACDPDVTNNNAGLIQIDRYWEITVGGTVPTATLTFSYIGTENNINTASCGGNIAPQRYDVVNDEWGTAAGGGGFVYTTTPAATAGVTGAAVGTCIVAGINTFSPWTLVSSSNPLPVTLLTFNANAVDQKQVDVTWRTSSETNNDYFIVEKTKDGRHYEFAGKIKGAGNSSEPLNYKLRDPSPFEGVSYYRLTQTDFNGKTKTYDPVAVDLKATQNFEVYPNPSDGSNLMMKLSGDFQSNQEVLVVVYDMQGRETYSKIVISNNQSGEVIAAMDPSNKLAKGMYLVTATSSNQIYKQKIVIE